MPIAAKSHAERIRKPRQYRKHWKRSDPFYRTARWQKFRKMFLARHPLCADPFGYHATDGVTVGATEVDHVQRIKHGGEKLDSANCQALCKACHSYKTAMEQRE
jgi:5-methylcytosine-specific restriction protein A